MVFPKSIEDRNCKGIVLENDNDTHTT